MSTNDKYSARLIQVTRDHAEYYLPLGVFGHVNPAYRDAAERNLPAPTSMPIPARDSKTVNLDPAKLAEAFRQSAALYQAIRHES